MFGGRKVSRQYKYNALLKCQFDCTLIQVCWYERKYVWKEAIFVRDFASPFLEFESPIGSREKGREGGGKRYYLFDAGGIKKSLRGSCMI